MRLNESEPPISNLTKKGLKDIQYIESELSDKNIDVIYCSPLTRTRETAKLINGKSNVPVIIEPRIGELAAGFNDRPIWNLLLWRLMTLFNRSIHYKDGESLKQVEDRVGNFLVELSEKKYNVVVLVTHQHILSVIAKLLNLSIRTSLTSHRQILKFRLPSDKLGLR